MNVRRKQIEKSCFSIENKNKKSFLYQGFDPRCFSRSVIWCNDDGLLWQHGGCQLYTMGRMQTVTSGGIGSVMDF